MTHPALRIAIVVTDAYSPDDPDHDTPVLLTALRERGIDAQAAVWHDEAVAWEGFDLVVIRSPWDYPERAAEFMAWLERVDAATTVANSPALMRWNLDKHYLSALEDAGIAGVPTSFCGSLDEARTALASHAGGRVVVKPAVSAGARDTGLFDGDDPAALALAARIVAADGVAMVQPEIAELSEGAEKALYAIDGQITHAIAKGALLAPGGGLIGGVYVEHPEDVPFSDAEAHFALRALDAVAAVTGEAAPLYARVDLVDSAAYGLVVLEVELVEPALNLHVVPEVTPRVAEAIVRAAGAAR